MVPCSGRGDRRGDLPDFDQYGSQNFSAANAEEIQKVFVEWSAKNSNERAKKKEHEKERPKEACICQGRAVHVLMLGELSATIGAGTPAGARARRLGCGGAGLAAERQVR